jgi:2-polyprenyl-6-methoxyphenol hydroxylase-like FAD-dependent oxidoreductase
MADIMTRCCVVGGGPAGMMLGFLLARAGIDVVVLEKHADFLRKTSGDVSADAEDRGNRSAAGR